MKIMRFHANGEDAAQARLGVLLDGDLVGDLRAGYGRHLSDAGDGQAAALARARFPTEVGAFLAGGAAADDALKRTFDILSTVAPKDPATVGPDGGSMFVPLADCRLLAPLRPSKLIAIGKNYREHQAEVGGEVIANVPSAWVKANSTVCGPTDDVVKPHATSELDYETEFSIVIGRRCKDVPEDKAYDVIAGYTIVNDVSARDVARLERKEGNQLLGKMFDTFAPMGPWLVTRDEIEDPMNLAVRTRVNGEIRQDSNTSETIWSVPQLISYISQMTLEPGDVITTGTPEGCAMGHKPDVPSWFLKPGDVMESEVEGIGVMTNRIVAEPDKEGSWKW